MILAFVVLEDRKLAMNAGLQQFRPAKFELIESDEISNSCRMILSFNIYSNVCGKRAPQVSERRTLPNLRTSPISTNNSST